LSRHCGEGITNSWSAKDVEALAAVRSFVYINPKKEKKRLWASWDKQH
jgi:hypothetical protein